MLIATLRLLLWLCAVWISSLSAQEISQEYRLKAAFISKFPQFVEWPEAALRGRTTLDICVGTPNPFGDALAALVAGESLDGRPLIARGLADMRDLDSCQVLFVPAQSANQRRALLAKVATLPVLTVGDDPDFLDEGGIVNLRVADNRVRFEVNVGAAQRAGVRLSSQLLRLAMNIRGGPS